MAEFDDERPPGDDRSDEPPETGTGGLRRFPPRERGDRYGDEEGTGEVPRPRDPPPADDFGFEDLDDEPPPPRTARSSRPRSSGGSGGRRPPRGRSRSSRGAGGGGAGGGGAAVLRQPRARLALAIVFAAVLILVIVLVVRDCQRNQLEDSYTSYLNDVSAIVVTSAEQGKQLRQ